MRCFNKLRQQFKKFRERGVHEALFVEEQRERRRMERGRSKVSDIFLYSSSEDYFTLRLLYNLPIGLGIAWLVYYFAWYRINFADSDLIFTFWGTFMKWLMIVAASLAYSLNPLVRSALGFALFSGLSSTTQGIISVFVLEKLSEGPIMNVIQNFNVSTKITICHLELQAKITKRRIELQAGPLEALFEKNFGNATTIGKKVIQTLKSLIQPFDEDVVNRNEEDTQLEAIIDTAKQLADRQLSTEGESVDRSAKPALKRLKSKLGQAIAGRFEQRCKYIFASSVDSCHKKFEETQSLCYNSIPWPIGYFTCSRMNALTLCQPEKIRNMFIKFCELGQQGDVSREEHETLFSPELDEQMNGLQNVTKQIERQLQLNLHFQAVEQPEIERGYSLNQLESEVKHDVKIFKVILDTFKMVLGFVVVMFTYFVFRGCVESTLKYLNDIEYKNFFTTRYFWRIDEKRKREGKPYLHPIRKEELKHNKVTGPNGYPRADEISKTLKSLIRWSVIAFIVIVVVMVDHYFFRMLEIVVTHGKIIRHQRGGNELNIVVNGTGAIADLLRRVLNINYSQQLNEHLDNAHCLNNKPYSPDWDFNTKYLFVPLVGMLFLQVFFNFVVQRLALFYVLGLMFPRRAKTRIIHLYNKMLIARVNMDRMEALNHRQAEEERDVPEAVIDNE